MPNIIAYAALLLWPLASVMLFQKLPPGRALIASLLIGYLFLPPPPAGWDFPLLPPLTKETIPSLVALVICLVRYPGRIRLLPEGALTRVLVLLFVFSPVLTVATNGEPAWFGRFALPGLQPQEAIGVIVQQAILIAPFLVARNLIAGADDHRDLLAALLIGGLVYSLFMLVEVRLSPQINIWVYGYFQHSFDQMIRFGGFRPIVFLYHGIWVAFFAMTAILAGLVLLRRSSAPRARVWLAAASVYLLAVLVLAKSVAALVYAMAFAPVVLLLSQRWQLRLALLLALIAVTYPLSKGAGLVPDDRLLAAAEAIDSDRAASLRFRFENESVLLDRAMDKPLFGWGSWGRNHQHQVDNGRQLTVADGRWIITIGAFGWVGFLAEFLLLTLPIAMIWWRSHGALEPVSPWIGALALILAINVLDLLPNATLTPLTWLFAGAVLGHAEQLHRRRIDRRPAPLRTVL